MQVLLGATGSPSLPLGAVLPRLISSTVAHHYLPACCNSRSQLCSVRNMMPSRWGTAHYDKYTLRHNSSLADTGGVRGKKATWTVACLRLYLPLYSTGGHPSSHHFDQRSIRAHLHSCLMAGRFSAFTVRRLGRENSKKVRMSQAIQVDCNCRMPENFADRMIQCNSCRKWFHLD